MEEIKPIDKFTLDRYVKEEDDLLEYIELIGKKYCPDIYNNIVLDATQATFQFKNRYNRNKVRLANKFNLYWKDKEIQEYLSILNVDAEKFWYLFLFVYDYSWGQCINNLAFDKSAKSQIGDFMHSVAENYNGDDCKFIKSMKLTLNIGSKSIVIDKEIAIAQIAIWCNGGYEEVDGLNHSEMTNNQRSRAVLAYHLCNMVIDFFTERCIPRKDNANISNNEKGLLCRLLSLTTLYEDKKENLLNYRLNNYSTLKGILYPKKVPEFSEINNYY